MARKATGREALNIVLGLGTLAVALYGAMKYGPKALQAIKGATGSGFALGGGLPGSARTTTMPAQLASSSAPGGGMASGVSADLNKLFSSLFKGRSGTETVAQALQRGNTSINQGLLASIFNIQNYGNPYGDARDMTLAAFASSTSPNIANYPFFEDTLLSRIDASGISNVAGPTAFDFGSFGYAPSDFYGSMSDWWDSMTGPSVQYADPGYIEQQSPQLFDFGSWGLTPDQFGTYAGTYQGDTYGVASYSGNYADSQLDPTYNPFAGYDAAAYSNWNGYSGPVDAPDPWGIGANSPNGISDQVFA